MFSFDKHDYTYTAKPRERNIREPLEAHTEPLAPIFIEKPENTSAKEGKHVRISSCRISFRLTNLFVTSSHRPIDFCRSCG